MFWSSLKKEPAGAATPLLDVACGLSPPLLNVQALGIGVGVGVGVAVGVTVGVGVGVPLPPPHRTRIKMEWKLLAARNVKSTGSAGLIAVKVTTTGLNVPGTNGGIITTALVGTPTCLLYTSDAADE